MPRAGSGASSRQPWWDAFQGAPLSPSQLNILCTQRELLDSVRGGGGERSQTTRLGLALGNARDRVFGGLRVCMDTDKGSKKGRLYMLERASRTSDVGDLGSQGPQEIAS